MTEQTEKTEPTNANSSKKLKKQSTSWFKRHKVTTGLLVIVLIIILSKSFGGSNTGPTSANTANTSDTSSKDQPSSPTTSTPAVRQVTGTATTLGAGNFSVGSDVAVGLYDVTAPAGQSGNFIVNGTDGTAVYNEVIGNPSDGDVSKIRVNLTKGEQVQISGMSGVTFTPVTAAFVTAHATTSLYAGSFTVGQDIGAGKYVVTPASGESGNFDVYDSSGNNKVNEILGSDSSMGDVPSYTLTLNSGDIIQLQGIDSVTFTAQ